MKNLLILLVLLFSSPLLAANRYVDNSASCPGSGTSGSPYCSIQNAFKASLAAGDNILIRTGSRPYDESAILKNKSGQPGSPITIQPDVGSSPVLTYTGYGARTGSIDIQDSSYVTVTGLKFVGTGNLNLSRYAVRVVAITKDVTNVLVTKLSIKNWQAQNSYIGMRSIYFGGTDGTRWQVKNSTISNNVITGSRTQAINVNGAANITISGNDISGVICGKPTASGYIYATGIQGGSNNSALAPANNGTNYIITGNVIHDFQPFNSCTVIDTTAGASWTGMHMDVNVDKGTIANNRVYNIAQAKTTSSGDGITAGVGVVGIEVESRCDSWVVKENIVYNIGHYGIQNSSGSYTNTSNSFINNTVYKVGRYAFYAPNAALMTVKNNAFHGKSPIYANIGMTDGNTSHSHSTTQGPHVIDYNAYWDDSGGKVGVWNSSKGTLNFSSWKTACGCDNHSLNVDPKFVNLTAGSEDFHLQSTSTLNGKGAGGVDIGAYP